MSNLNTALDLGQGVYTKDESDTLLGNATAWINFNGTNGSIRNSFGISSVTRLAKGSYSVYFTKDMVDTNYVGIMSVSDAPQDLSPKVSGLYTNKCNLWVEHTAQDVGFDPVSVYVVFYGGK